MQRLSVLAFVLILLTARAAAAAGAEDAAVALVNGVAVTASQLTREVDRLIPMTTYHRSVSEERRKELARDALENLITRELQVQDAAARGIKPDKNQVKDQLEQIRKRYPSKKEYKAALERSRLTEDGLRKEIEGMVMVRTLTEQIVSGPSKMSDEALRKYYEDNKDKFRVPESVKIRIISTWDEKRAAEAAQQIKAGEPFADAAERVSEDKYRVVGGDVGWLHRGQLIQQLEDAAFASPVSQVQGPLKAEGMWYLFLVDEKKPPYLMTFEESRDKLKKELEQKRARELQQAWIAELRSKAKIEILQDHASPAAHQ